MKNALKKNYKAITIFNVPSEVNCMEKFAKWIQNKGKSNYTFDALIDYDNPINEVKNALRPNKHTQLDSK